MMVKIFVNNREIANSDFANYKALLTYIAEKTSLCPNEFYLEQNGKRLSDELGVCGDVHLRLRVCGGKGGFGSMLRAIGAQIEKTTNREACRDLSGRRLRDINEEKRLKAWLEKQGEREREAEERKKRKVEKLLSVPKHEFKDDKYEEARSKLTEKVNDSVEFAFKNAETTKSKTDLSGPKVGSKRNQQSAASSKTKKKKTALWIDDDVLDSDDDSDEDDDSDSADSEKVSKQAKSRESTSDSEDIQTSSIENATKEVASEAKNKLD